MEWRERDGVRWLEADLGRATAAFSTRLGGVSEPPFDRLNLGVLTDDEDASVVENRRRLAGALDLATGRIPIGLQVHGAELAIHAGPQRPSPFAEPGGEIPEVDGHVVTAPGLAPLVFTADCLPVALAGPGGAAMLHCGWRGLAAGIVAAGAEAVGATDAAIGPGIGLCCYEVGGEVLDAFADLGDGIAAGRRLDLVEVATRLLRATGVERVEAAGLCTSCEHGSSTPTAATPVAAVARAGWSGSTGRAEVAGLIHGIDPEKVRGNLERVREATGDGVEILVACKYVPLEEMGALAEAGVTLVGENRQQDLAAKHERWGDSFAWDFIGNLQSRKVKQVLPLCRLVHSVATDSVLREARQARRPRDRGTGRGQHRRRGGQGGSGARGSAGLRRALPGPGLRADDDAALQPGSRGFATAFRPPRRARRRQRPRAALDGHLAGLAGRGGGGGDDHPAGHGAVRVNRR